MPDECLTAAEIAARFKLNQQTVRNWIADGELPAVWVGKRQVRVRETDLDVFLSESVNRREQVEAGDPWTKVAEAAQAATAAARKQDGYALDRAMSGLADAAQGIPSESDGAPTDPTSRAR